MAYDALGLRRAPTASRCWRSTTRTIFAALWPDVEPLARDGPVALALVNSMACVVPSGGTKALFGTNPIASAAPRAGHDPLVFDSLPAPWPMAMCRLRREGWGHRPRVWRGLQWAANDRPARRAGRRCATALWRPAQQPRASALSMMVELPRGAHRGHFRSNSTEGHPGAQNPAHRRADHRHRPGQEPGRLCPALRRPGSG